jgi:hypothetical protein
MHRHRAANADSLRSGGVDLRMTVFGPAKWAAFFAPTAARAMDCKRVESYRFDLMGSLLRLRFLDRTAVFPRETWFPPPPGLNTSNP